MATEAAEAAFENPLIPNAKLRQMYRAMMRARTLAKALPPGRRDGLGLEACLVSTSVDLGPGDLVGDTLAGGVIAFLRGATLDEAMRPGNGKTRGPVADCGAAAQLPADLGIAERMWALLGAAAALKAAGDLLRKEAKAAKAGPKDGPVMVAYTRAGEVPDAVWKKALTYAAEKELPVVFVVLPAGDGRRSGGGVTALALKCRIPAIPVDLDDAVAMYRVAQESIGRARIGVGAALLECVPFVLEGAGKSATTDGIAGLEAYLLQRKVVSRVWMRQEAMVFAKRVARAKAASK